MVMNVDSVTEKSNVEKDVMDDASNENENDVVTQLFVASKYVFT